jgi:hypothetical protein
LELQFLLGGAGGGRAWDQRRRRREGAFASLPQLFLDSGHPGFQLGQALRRARISRRLFGGIHGEPVPSPPEPALPLFWSSSTPAVYSFGLAIVPAFFAE